MISGLTILRANDTHQHERSYVLPAEAARISRQPKDDAGELFMVFNALIHDFTPPLLPHDCNISEADQKCSFLCFDELRV